ncbi:MAG: OprO/OprP family phosphate-selective porin [Planctomycetaceae bacterium]|nr:OprO/OprP family phosphate-selective porin [Planctomycetaceae bacterium]
MRKSCSFFLLGALSFALIGGTTALGNEPASGTAGETVIQDAAKDSGLTPHRKGSKPVILAQEGAVPQTAPTPVTITQVANVSEKKETKEAKKPVPAPPQTQTVTVVDPKIYSDIDGLRAEIEKLKSADKKPDTKKSWSSPKITGRLIIDTFAVDQKQESFQEYGDVQNRAGIRNMQIGISGSGFESFDYKLEVSLSPTNGQVSLYDNWIGAKNIPLLGYVRVGHYKPDVGLAYPGSELHTTLTEFTGPSSTFGLGRRVGISSTNLFARDRVRLFTGVFQAGATNINRYIPDDNQGEVVNVRLSAVPLFCDEGKKVLHLGGHWEYVHTDYTKSATMSTNFGSVSFLETSLTTGAFANDCSNRGGFEFAYQNGPFSVASEIYTARFNAFRGEPDRTANGAYVELKYFLTGEYRTYSLANGNFGAAKVKRNFHPFDYCGWNLIDGFGAWQAVVGWSYLDLTDWRDYNGRAGRQNDITLGMNWFWTPNLRWIFEYIHSEHNFNSAKNVCYEDIFGTSIRVYF